MNKNQEPFLLFRLLSRNPILFFWISIALFTIISFYLNWIRAGYSDVSWLLHGARLILEGGNFYDDFFETNPPYNTVFYIPAVIIQNLTGLHIHHASIIYLLPLTLILSLIIIWNAQNLINFKDHNEKSLFLLYAALFVFFALIKTGDQIGQRDILAGLGALGLVFSILRFQEYKFYNQYKLSIQSWISILICLPCAFLKPHWGLFILLAFAYRAFQQKRITVIFDYDFLVISLLTSLYLYFSFILFPEYFAKVMPYVMELYVAENIFSTFKRTIAITILTSIVALSMLWLSRDLSQTATHKKYLKLFFMLTVISLVPVAIQNKGFLYHYYVSFYFLTLMIVVFMQMLINTFLSNKKIIEYLFSLFLVSFVSITIFAHYKNTPTKWDYLNVPLIPAIQNYSTSNDSYFIFHRDMGFVFPTNNLIDRKYGSRFASFWFLNGYKPDVVLTPLQYYKHNYFINLFVEDIKKHQPKIIAFENIYYKETIEGDYVAFDVVAYLKQNKDFQAQWKNYKLRENLIFNTDIHPYLNKQNKSIEFDLYVRQ